jgi:two-component system chemotaxis response regulator CheY
MRAQCYGGAMSDAKRVVIADDEPQVRQTLTEFFSTAYAGCVVEAVADGELAVAAVRRATPTLVLLDIEMPGMDGVAALKEIRAIASGVPVIMVTGNESSRVAGHVLGLERTRICPSRSDCSTCITSSRPSLTNGASKGPLDPAPLD